MNVILSIVILIVLSIMGMIVASQLSRITKVPNLIYLMLIGIIIGPFGLAIADKLTAFSGYSSLAIVILFLVSGLSTSKQKSQSSSKKIMALGSIPSITEGLVIGGLAVILLNIFDLFGNQPINGFAVLAVMVIFAMSSPAIIIPIAMKGKAKGIQNPILDQINSASLTDNFLPFPIAFLALMIALSIESGTSMSVGQTALKMVAMIGFFTISFIITKFIGKKLALINKLNLKPLTVAIIIYGFTIGLITLLGSAGASIGILAGFGIGGGFSGATEPKLKAKILKAGQPIYDYGFLPVIFIYIGTQLQLDKLLSLDTIIVCSIITVAAIGLKGTIGKLIVRYSGDQKASEDFVFYAFAAKGKILINISLVVGPIFIANGMDYMLQFIYMLAAISILISTPYATTKMEKQLKVMEQLEMKQA